MSNVLLELGCEEIPARFMPGLLEDLKKKAEEKLARERLSFSRVEAPGTFRRLVLYIENLSPRQSDVVEEVKGPPAEAAFDAAGKPTAAAAGFAKAQKVSVEKLTVKTVGQKNYVFAKVIRKGKSTERVLGSLLPEIIAALYLPLSMRWGKLDFKFIRPIHSILALYGRKIIKFELAGVASSNKTFGRRYVNFKVKNLKLKTADLSLYKKLLCRLGVVVDPEERKKQIRERVEAAAKKKGAKALMEEELLNEVAYLIENPVVYPGKFDPAFLDTPQEVLITSMQKNQKYFPLIDRGGELTAGFIVVTDGSKNPKVVEGNEKVLSARLADARFFFEEDKKVPLRLRIPDLEKISFFEKLGNMHQRMERIKKLSEWVAKRMGQDEDGIKSARRIAELSKADLTTRMVYEFPELQGKIGKEYALLSGEDPRVAEGIFEHYLPRFAEDRLPQSLEGTAVAIADRLDLLVGAFAAGCIPTGSEDPYGIRRVVHGFVRIILEKKLDILLDEAIELAFGLYKLDAREFPKVKKEILEFIAGRLRPLLLEKGIRYDAADAALFEFNAVLDAVKKAEAINPLIGEEWFHGVVASADRLSRIAGNAPREQILEQDLEEEEEKKLFSLYLKVNWEAGEKTKNEDWAGAAKELAALTDPIESFFDKVLVMHEDERLKLNRLALLKSLERMYLRVIDFRKIVF